MSTAGEHITIACVLRSGGEFNITHVVGLYEQVKRHVHAPFVFECLTDTPFNYPGITCVQMRDGWPGWWSKLELFRVFYTGSTFYMDLDTMLTSDITDIVMPKWGFWGLRDFNHSGRLASGLMAWEGDHSYLYEEFKADPVGHMKKHMRPSSWGDQGFIEEHLRVPPIYLQDHYGNRIVSFKKDVLSGGELRAEPSIICFHGNPRPWMAVQSWPVFDQRRLKWTK